MSWAALGAVAPGELMEARLQLHHAAQVVASAGLTLLELRADDSHPNLGWVDDLGALVGHALPGAGARAGLRVADLALVVVDERGVARDALPLDGRTLADGQAWLAATLAAAGASLPAAVLTRSPYEIPAHPVATGAAFSGAGREALAELGRWFADGHAALVEQAGRMPGAPEVRCWPHHFDLGALAVLATNPDGSLARSVGIGLSPGDESYAEPYWYVSPWPYPDPGALPALEAGGRWHTAGFTAAVLTGSELVGEAPERQPDRVRRFLREAAEASCRALGATAD